ncbi:MAG: hypothetical protein ACYC99_14995, partial [Candidatus Geothermincolia bacterium]
RRQLRPLQRQAGRLEQYQTLVSDLNQARIRLDVANLRAMQREWQAHEDSQRERSSRLADLDAEIQAKAAAASALEKVQSDWRTRESELRSGLYKLVSFHERLKAMLTLWEEKTRRVKEEDAALPAPDPEELEGLGRSNKELEQSRASLLERQETLRADDARLASRAVELNRMLNEIVRERAGIEARLEVLKAGASIDAGAAEEWNRRRIAELEKAGAELQRIRPEVAALQAAAAEAAGALQDAEAKIASLQVERVRLLTELREVEKRQAGLVATLEILARMETETWTPANTSAALMEGDPTGGGLGGMLATSLEIDKAHEAAITSYLGPWLFGLVARDTRTIVTAIEHLKKHGLGQGLFFKHNSEPVDR